MSAARSASHRSRPVVVALACLVLAIYGPAVRHAFLPEYDDAKYVTDNPHVRTGLSARNVSWALTSVSYASNWHPLTWLSHMVDVQLFGLDARGHHAVNVLLHALNAARLFLVLRRMSGSHWRSALAAALFAAHPLNVESVAWVAERKNLLSTCLAILGIGAYLGYARGPRPGRYLAVLAVFAGGLMAKSMLVTLPLVFLLLDYWPLGRRGLGGLLLEKVPLLLLSGAAGAVALRAQSGGSALASLASVPLAARIATSVAAYAAYLRTTVWPAGLSFFYPRPDEALLSPAVLAAALLLLAGTVLALRRSGAQPSLAVGWGWFLGTLLPVVGLVQAGAQGRADRYAYLPAIGLFLIVAWGIPGGRPRLGRAAAAAALLAVLGLGAAARIQVGSWRDGETLFRRALAVDPGNWVAENYLGLALLRAGRGEEAYAHVARAVALKPNYTDGLFNLAGLLHQRGSVCQAAEIYRRIIRLRPGDQDAHFNLGTILLRQGSPEAAAARFEAALRLRPGDAAARAGLEEARRGRAGQRPAGR